MLRHLTSLLKSGARAPALLVAEKPHVDKFELHDDQPSCYNGCNG